MKLRTIRKGIYQGFLAIFKNGLMSLASIGTIAACLFILGLSYCVVANIDIFLSEIDDTLGIEAFIEGATSQEDIDYMQEQIKNKTQVKEVTYISPEEAWERFKEHYKDDEDFLEGLDGTNPLESSASFEIHLYNAADQGEIVAYLETLPAIRKINYSKESADILTRFSLLVRYVSIVLIGVLVLISVLLITNTIKLSVYVRRYEINIMKYIGAKDSFIKWPFIVEGMIIGLIGAILPLGIVYFAYSYVIGLIQRQFDFIMNFIEFADISSLMQTFIPLFIGMGVTMGILGSSISIKRHLKV